MTKITIPSGGKTAFRIPTKPTQPEKQDIERIGVSAEVASEMLGVGVRTMWTLAKERRVRTVRIGRRVLFSVQSLREFVDGKSANADKADIACVAEGKDIIFADVVPVKHQYSLFRKFHICSPYLCKEVS